MNVPRDPILYSSREKGLSGKETGLLTLMGMLYNPLFGPPKRGGPDTLMFQLEPEPSKKRDRRSNVAAKHKRPHLPLRRGATLALLVGAALGPVVSITHKLAA